MQRFPQKRIAVTGAGSGLGRALALRFAKEGWKVACSDINEPSAKETLALVERAGGQGFAQACNVRKTEEMESFAERVQREWQGLDILVNNAGVGSSGSIIDSRYSDWESVLDINLVGVIRGCKSFAPDMTAQKSGHIVNIASIAAIATPPGMAAYNVSKAGVLALSESLRTEVKDLGVDVSVVCPAFFKSNLSEGMISPDPTSQARLAKILSRASVSADDVADYIFRAVKKKQFLILPHQESRLLTASKRIAPEFFYKLVRQKGNQANLRWKNKNK